MASICRFKNAYYSIDRHILYIAKKECDFLTKLIELVMREMYNRNVRGKRKSMGPKRLIDVFCNRYFQI